MAAERRLTLLAGLVVVAALSLAACGKSGGAEGPPERGDQAVAKVDGKTVWASDVKREAVAQALSSDPSAKLLIEGNCDERGTEEYNRSLGDRRALAARKELVKMGISASRILTKSFGKDKPANPGHDESAWTQNRRDDFIILRPNPNGGGNMGGS